MSLLAPLLLLAMFSAPPPATAAALSPQPGNLGEALYYAAMGASGSKLCDRAQARIYGADFNARYSARIRRLMQIHEAHFGADPEFIVTTDCGRWDGSGEAQERRHDEAMDAFKAQLRALERRFGGY